MWTKFASLWECVNPNSTTYNFMRQPLLSGDVWIAFDHVARVLEALQQKPDEFIVFPAPAGPKGRGYMEVVAGLAAVKRAPDKSGAAELIDYLTQPEAQIATARSVGFFPVTKVSLPSDIAPGVRMVAAAIQKTQSAKDALPALQPILPGQSAGEFDKVFMDTFQLVALQGQDPRAVLDREAETLNNLMRETGTPCWQPDPPSSGPCRVQ
jgi:multiple sugar transport system substrate-binding protein